MTVKPNNFSFAGVCSQRLTNVEVMASEMVALYCPLNNDKVQSGTKLIWIHYAAQAMDLSGMSMAEQKQMGVVVHGRNLVILSAFAWHQGNYSCSAG